MLFSLWPIFSSIVDFLPKLPLFCFASQSSVFILFYYPNAISLIVSPSTTLSKSLLGNALGKSAKERGLKTDTGVVLHEEQDDSPKAVGSEIIFGAGVMDPDEFQRYFYVVGLNGWSDSSLIVIKAVVIHKKNFSTPYPYEFYCIYMSKVPETVDDLCRYGFYIWDWQIMKDIGNTTNESSSKNASKQDR